VSLIKNKIKALTILIISIILISLVFLPIGSANEEESAEVSLILLGEIPPIEYFKDNVINIMFKDDFGLNWTNLKERYGKLLKFLPGEYGVSYFLLMKIWWPIYFGKDVAKALGYTSVNFYAEFLDNQSGWHAHVEPATVTHVTGGVIKNLRVHVKIEDLTASCTATLRIKCTRIGITGEPIGVSYVDIPLKAAPYHYAEVRPTAEVKNVAPASEITIPVDITNRGNYFDTFVINVEGGNGAVGLASQQNLVLNPGETRRIYVRIMTPEVTLFDPGTIRQITIQVHSVDDPTSSFIGSIAVKTFGFYLSPPLLLGLGVIILIIIISSLVVYYRREKELQSLYGKPEKPWKIPEERKHLEKLKKKDIEKYKKELEMMREEYQSALLWYKHYQEAMKPKTEREKKIALLEYKRDRLQEKLNKKMEDEWRKRWEREYEMWKEECKKIQLDYRKKKASILNKWERKKREIKEEYDKLNRERKEKGLPPLPMPEIPEPELPAPPTLPPEPIKPPKPVVPKYEIDYEKMEIIPPKEELFEKEEKETTVEEKKKEEKTFKETKEDIRKAKLLEKIKKDQEKQLRKLKKQMERYKNQV